MAIIGITIILLVVTAWVLVQFRRQHRKCPPGPYPFPIIGNILHLTGKSPHESLAKLSKIHGPLMSLHLGSKYAVVINSPEMEKGILQKHDLAFSGRSIPAAAEAYDHEKMSMLLLSVGDEWRKLRKICREHMFTSSRLRATQSLRIEYLQKLSDYVQRCSRNGTVVNLREATFITILNLMSVTLFSIKVVDFDSTHEFKEIFEGLINVLGIPNSADFFPILKPLDPQGIQRKSKAYLGRLLNFIDRIIQQRLESRKASHSHYTNKDDFLQVLLDICQESGEQHFSVNSIKHLLMDLFVAGSDTSASAVEWAMTELLFHPEKLSKAKQELRTAMGDEKNAVVGESDVSRLPYLQAVVKEALRLHPPGPLLFPHKAEHDERVHEYTIPKGTQILINVWAMGRDPSVWSNPDAFDPERFLEQRIEFKGKDFELIPFGGGRRMCPGLPLADPIIHTILATLVHKFDWKLEAGDAYQHHRGQLAGFSLRSLHPLRATPITTSSF